MRTKQIPPHQSYTMGHEELARYRELAAVIPTDAAKPLRAALDAYDVMTALVAHCKSVEDLARTTASNAVDVAGSELAAVAVDGKRIHTVASQIRATVLEAQDAHRVAVVDTDVAIKAVQITINAISPALTRWGVDGFVWAAAQRAHLGPLGELSGAVQWYAQTRGGIRVPEECVAVPGGAGDIPRDLRGVAGPVALRYEDNPDAYRQLDIVDGRWAHIPASPEYRNAYRKYHHRTAVHYWATCAIASGQFRQRDGVGLIITADWQDRNELEAAYMASPAPVLMM